MAMRDESKREGEFDFPGERVVAECFILANGAEVANGMVYVLGGGWDELRAQAFPTVHPRISIAVVLSVPWLETNREHSFTITLRDEDGQSILPEPLTGSFNVGRPAHVVPGDPLKIPTAVNLANIQLQREGRYTFVLEVDGRELARTSFRARKVG